MMDSNMRVTLLGANGFVGSAFARLLKQTPGVELAEVEIHNYAEFKGQPSDIVIEAACNSRKFFADQEPVNEFKSSVQHRLETLFDFPAPFHLHISSVDVYSDLSSPLTTREDSPVDLATASHYGFHKLLAEQLVQHYARDWVIVRLAGMVGPGLRKNPVYDILHGQPIRIHPESLYQFMHTDTVARLAWQLVEAKASRLVINLAGKGLVSPRDIAKLAGKELDLSMVPPNAEPRIVDVNTDNIELLSALPSSREAVGQFIQGEKLKTES